MFNNIFKKSPADKGPVENVPKKEKSLQSNVSRLIFGRKVSRRFDSAATERYQEMKTLHEKLGTLQEGTKEYETTSHRISWLRSLLAEWSRKGFEPITEEASDEALIKDLKQLKKRLGDLKPDSTEDKARYIATLNNLEEELRRRSIDIDNIEDEGYADTIPQESGEPDPIWNEVESKASQAEKFILEAEKVNPTLSEVDKKILALKGKKRRYEIYKENGFTEDGEGNNILDVMNKIEGELNELQKGKYDIPAAVQSRDQSPPNIATDLETWEQGFNRPRNRRNQ